MPAPFLDATLRHPLTLPTGETYTNTVWLARVIDHPNIEVGDFTYYNDFDPVDDYAARIAPNLHPGAPEKLSDRAVLPVRPWHAVHHLVGRPSEALVHHLSLRGVQPRGDGPVRPGVLRKGATR